jgi:hypothetical protein
MLNFAKPPAEMEFETGSTPSTNSAEVLVETLFSDSVDVLRVVDPDETVVDAETIPPRLNEAVAVVNCTRSARNTSKTPTYAPELNIP